MKKRQILTIILFWGLTLTAQTTLNLNTLDFKRAYAVGEITNLPDTITIFTINSQLQPKQNFTELSKAKSDNYTLSYWHMEEGGIVDPTHYKYDLKIKFNGSNLVTLSFAKAQKTYQIKHFQKTETPYYILQSGMDSSKFKSFQQQLDGCWKTKQYQFKYSKENNSGVEYKSHVHSSAPIFSLILKDKEVYLDWIELTGGACQQKVVRISKSKLTVINEDRKKVIYKRNNGCN